MKQLKALPKKCVLIVGAGFGGLSAAKILSKHPELELLILDRRNHHLFQPLLYQVAMAGLNPADIAMPIRSIFHKSKNTTVLLEEVTDVLLQTNQVRTTQKLFSYDYLILACGAQHSYFGHPEWESFAPGLKTLEQATEIRRRVLTAFEMAEKETDPIIQQAYLTFVVVGGGPTGVELAGALGEITQYTLSQDFRNIDPTKTKILLIEAGPRILASFEEDLGKKAHADLKKLGVEVLINSKVTDIQEKGVLINGEWLNAKTTIWAAGVQPSQLNKKLGAETDRIGRVIVNDDLSLKKFSNVFVIGDQAHSKNGNGQPLPGLAPVAIQEGKYVAHQILNDLSGKPRKKFTYFDKGQMATIGRKKAIVQFKRLRFNGFLAWLSWLFIHIYYLIGFRNKFFVLCQWAYSYYTYQRGARLITTRQWESEDKPASPS